MKKLSFFISMLCIGCACVCFDQQLVALAIVNVILSAIYFTNFCLIED